MIVHAATGYLWHKTNISVFVTCSIVLYDANIRLDATAFGWNENVKMDVMRFVNAGKHDTDEEQAKRRYALRLRNECYDGGICVSRFIHMKG